MSGPIQDGGPAFPGGISATPKASDNAPPTQVGMSLRDYFAGQALVGWITGTRDPEASEWEPAWWAREAYLTADAMLKAREVKP